MHACIQESSVRSRGTEESVDADISDKPSTMACATISVRSPIYRSKGGYVQTHQYRQNNVFHVVIRLGVVVERPLPLTTAYPSLGDSS